MVKSMNWYCINTYEETVAGPFKNVKGARVKAMKLLKTEYDAEDEPITLSQVKSHYDKQFFWGDMVVSYRRNKWICTKCIPDNGGYHRMLTYEINSKGELIGQPIEISRINEK